MARADLPQGARRKLIEFDAETWLALHGLAVDRMSTLQELADEAFADLLRKHHRPVTLKEALSASAGELTQAAAKQAPREKGRKRTARR